MYFYCYVKIKPYICIVKQEQIITIKTLKIMATMRFLSDLDAELSVYLYEDKVSIAIVKNDKVIKSRKISIVDYALLSLLIDNNDLSSSLIDETLDKYIA